MLFQQFSPSKCHHATTLVLHINQSGNGTTLIPSKPITHSLKNKGLIFHMTAVRMQFTELLFHRLLHRPRLVGWIEERLPARESRRF